MLNLLRKAKYYKDCSELPVGTFFKILDKQDLTLLCYYGKLKAKELQPIWELIISEYETLTGSPEYHNQLAKSNNDCIRITKLNAMIALFWLVHYDKDRDYSEELTYWGLRGNDEQSIKTQILLERTKLSIDQSKRKAKEQAKKFENEDKSFEDIKAIIEEWRSGNYIDANKMTVKEWVSVCKRINQKSKAIKALNDGRRANKGE
jgi:hypothetical protein